MIRAEELLCIAPMPAAPRGIRVPLMSRHDESVISGILTGAKSATKARVHFASLRRAEFDAERPLWLEVGQALAKARWEKGLSQPKAAKLLGVGKSSLADYEIAERLLPEARWPAVLDVLGVDIAAMVALWRSSQ